MIRFLTLIGLALAITAAAGLYRVKLRTAELGAHVVATQRTIDRQIEAISVLKAEWSLLNQPARLQALAERHLDLTPIAADQFAVFAAIPRRDTVADPMARLLEETR